MELCTPAYRASYMELCTPAHRTSSMEMCTPAYRTSSMELCTPAYGTMEACTPAYRTGSKGSYMELCTPAYQAASMELCTPACCVSRVNSCTPGDSLLCTAPLEICTPAGGSGTVHDTCTGYLKSDPCSLSLQDVHTPLLRKSVRFKPCDRPTEDSQDINSASSPLANASSPLANASSSLANASSPLDNASSNISNILDLSSSPCLRLATFFLGSADKSTRESVSNISPGNIQENIELPAAIDSNKLETNAYKLEMYNNGGGLVKKLQDELDPDVLEPTVLEYHEQDQNVLQPEVLNLEVACRALELEPLYPATYWCTWSKPIKGFSEAFLM